MLTAVKNLNHGFIIQRYGWPVLLLLPMVGLLVFYVLQINRQAGQSYAYRTLELKRGHLEEQIHNLTWEVAAARSLAAIQTRSHDLGLVTPTAVSFIDASFSTVALVK